MRQATTAVIVVLVLLVALAGGAFLYKRKGAAKAGGAGATREPTVSIGQAPVAPGGAPPPPPPPSQGLPPGWTEGVDPASGVSYYYNASTQQTTWTRPQSF